MHPGSGHPLITRLLIGVVILIPVQSDVHVSSIRKIIRDFDWLRWTLTRYNRCFNAQRPHKWQTFEGWMNVKDHTAGLSVPAAAMAVLLGNLPFAIFYVCLNFTMYYLLGLADPDGWDLVFQFVMAVFVFLFALPVLSLLLFSTIMFNTSGVGALRAAVAFSFIWRGAVMSSIVGFGVICLWVVSVVITALLGNAAGNPYEFSESAWYWFGVTVFEHALDFLLYGLFGTWLAAVVAGGEQKTFTCVCKGETLFQKNFCPASNVCGSGCIDYSGVLCACGRHAS